MPKVNVGDLYNKQVRDRIKAKFDAFSPHLDERQQRMFAAIEAETLGRNGVSIVSDVTGLTATQIRAGSRDLYTAPKTVATSKTAKATKASSSEEAPKRRGRPKTKPNTDTTAKKGRGRPSVVSADTDEKTEEAPKRRGRPKTKPNTDTTAKKGRGRPRKVVDEGESTLDLPSIDDDIVVDIAEEVDVTNYESNIEELVEDIIINNDDDEEDELELDSAINNIVDNADDAEDDDEELDDLDLDEFDEDIDLDEDEDEE